jgi:hypothetical protein
MNKIAAFRMTPYIQRFGWSQVCCLIFTLAVFSLPLAGKEATQTPILIPLATKLVPLGTSLESPQEIVFQLSELVSPGKVLLGPLAKFGVEPNAGAGAEGIPVVGWAGLGQFDFPRSRSPPAI